MSYNLNISDALLIENEIYKIYNLTYKVIWVPFSWWKTTATGLHLLKNIKRMGRRKLPDDLWEESSAVLRLNKILTEGHNRNGVNYVYIISYDDSVT